MKKTSILNFSLAFCFFLIAQGANANCIWTTGNCADIGQSNNWTEKSDVSYCGSTTKPGGTAKCCCANETVMGCCQKTDSANNITTENLNGENCKKISYAATTFFQDAKAENNTCVEKYSSVGCTWRKQNTCPSYETRPEYGSNKKCAGEWPGAEYICCCSNKSMTTDTTSPGSQKPKFVMPELQVSIPGLTLTPTSSVKCNSNNDGTYYCEVPWLSEYILGIFNYGLSIAGILAAIILMAGGVLWLISSGDASKITQAKELIIGSITGLVILASSYVILYQINPALTQFSPIGVGTIKKQELQLVESKSGATSQQYKNADCATDEQLKNGVEFYATGYYKAPWGTSHHDLCMIAMQCSCPDGKNKDGSPRGRNMNDNCDDLFPNNKSYRPCNKFDQDTPYCIKTASGKAPAIGTIAGPANCSNLPYKPGTTQVCFKGKTYTITDTGAADTMIGRRIDIWSSSLQEAMANTGVGILKKGPCN